MYVSLVLPLLSKVRFCCHLTLNCPGFVSLSDFLLPCLPLLAENLVGEALRQPCQGILQRTTTHTTEKNQDRKKVWSKIIWLLLFWQTSRTTSGCKSTLFTKYSSKVHFLSTLPLVNRHFKTSQVSWPPVVNQPVLDSSGSPHLRNIMTFQIKVQTLHKRAHKFFLYSHTRLSPRFHVPVPLKLSSANCTITIRFF